MKPAHILLVIIIAATWGFNFVVIKVGVHDVPPFLFTGLRFSTIFGYNAWNYLLKRNPASVVAPVSLLVPVFGIISGVLGRVFSEPKLKKAEPLLIPPITGFSSLCRSSYRLRIGGSLKAPTQFVLPSLGLTMR